MKGVTVREIRRVRTFARVVAARSPEGARWLAMASPHWPEVLARLAVDATLADQAGGAAREVARLVLAYGAGRRPVVDDRVVAQAGRVLDRLDARGSASLRAVVADLRLVVEGARGRDIDDVLGRRASRDAAGRAGG